MARGNRARVCTVWLLVVVLAHGVAGISRNDLYPYASSDSLRSNGSDILLSAQVNLKTPIVFYDKTYKTIFVNGNGLLSFMKPMAPFNNIPFPLDGPLIAALYTHVDTRASGTVYWAESTAPDVLARAKSTIQRAFKMGKHFMPTSVFLATWKDVGYYNSKADKVNTFQIAIPTNGNESYVELLYPENDIKWIQAESYPNSYPDAKAQAGFINERRVYYTLSGSGTDQIQNIDKWSNVDRPGHWVFKVGPLEEGQNIETPDAIENKQNEKHQTCRTCHNKAICADYQAGFCCVCKDNYFGNGKSCLLIDNPLRVSGQMSGVINNNTIEEKYLHVYVNPKDGRIYMSVSTVQEDYGPSFQLATNLGGIVGWLFAKTAGGTKNGYQLTGGVFNHTFEIFFHTLGLSITIRNKFMGFDVYGFVKMDVHVSGSLPILSKTDQVLFENFEEIFTRTQLGTIRSSSSRTLKLQNSKLEFPVTVEQIITFDECKYAPTKPDQDSMKIKFSSGQISYENKEGIARIALTAKVTPLEMEDPCIQGKHTCMAHSSCVVEEDDFKCVCDAGYQQLFDIHGNVTCVDINECTSGNHLCSPNAICINQEGSFACQCKTGFFGDGHTCGQLPSCDNYECYNNEQCTIMNDRPHCICISGYERTQEGCVPIGSGHDSGMDHDYGHGEDRDHGYGTGHGHGGDRDHGQGTSDGHGSSHDYGQGTGHGHGSSHGHGQGTGHGSGQDHGYGTGHGSGHNNNGEQVSCDVINNCSENGVCSYDGTRHTYVCLCNHGYSGDGYQCWSDRDGNQTDHSPIPQCYIGICSCPVGWEYRNGVCVRRDDMQGSGDGVHDLIAYPLPECNEEMCFCPWGYIHQEKLVNARYEDVCVPAPELVHDTKGPSGDIISCNVVNRCHPHAQCIYEPSLNDYICRCAPGYDGDGDECIKTEVSCMEAEICDPNANCQKADGTYKCYCNPGFYGDGSTCFLIDECNDHHDCKKNERCNYVSSSNRYECTCNQGYLMVNGNCMVSDCSTKPAMCHINGQCVYAKDGSGYKCICIDGYRGDGVNQCLEDYIGCNVLNTCGRNAVCGYNQTSANYVCVCQPGYHGDGYSCVSQTDCGDDEISDGGICRPNPRYDSNFLLVNQGGITHKIPFQSKPKSPPGPIYMSDTHPAVGIDIDCLKKRVYVSDFNGNKITSFNYNGTNVESFMFGMQNPEGVSIDWVSRNIFWTDSAKKTIEAANLETRKKIILINQGLENPRGIAVHPYRGKLFWSDWNRDDPKLEWANEDGTDRQLFLRGSKVILPNSLCIDWATDELCWTNAGTNSINCANIDTKHVTEVVKDLLYPFGLAISQNHFYWTDWQTRKIEVALKSTGERQKSISTPLGGGDKLYDIVAVQEHCPEVTNVCEFNHGHCTKEQLCLPDGHGGRSCLCADNAVGECSSIRFES